MLNKKRKTIKLIYFVFVLLVLIPLFGVGVGGKAYADTDLSGYTNVLDDLKKDESFDTSEFPDNKADYDKSSYAEIGNFYSLHVIQIAESTAGELFVYVYQPAANTRQLTATQINMSLTEDLSAYDYDDNVDPDDSSDTDNDKWGGTDGQGHGGGGGSFHSLEVENTPSTYLYDLMFINRNGVFAKYKVSNFTVSKDFIRYYNITSIYRLWDSDIDEPSGNNNTINEVSFPVGKLYTVETVNGEISYKSEKRDVVQVTDLYADFLRYENGHSGLGIYLDNYTDSHIIAFSTNWDMSDLYDVDISFHIQLWQDLYASDMDYFLGHNPTFSNSRGIETKKTIVVERTDVGENIPSGWLKSKYCSWNRIQTVDNFKGNCGIALSAELTENLKGKQWVLQFYETDYSVLSMLNSTTVDYTKVTNETILRLHFKSNGKVYNLGAVSDSVSGDGNPGSIPDKKSLWDYFIEFCKWLESLTGVSYIMWAIIFFAVPICIVYGILSIFFPPLRVVFKFIGIGLKYFFIGLWWVIKYFAYGLWVVICLPFKGVYALIQRIRNR